jgi:hypothetical protein
MKQGKNSFLCMANTSKDKGGKDLGGKLNWDIFLIKILDEKTIILFRKMLWSLSSYVVKVFTEITLVSGTCDHINQMITITNVFLTKCNK